MPTPEKPFGFQDLDYRIRSQIVGNCEKMALAGFAITTAKARMRNAHAFNSAQSVDDLAFVAIGDSGQLIDSSDIRQVVHVPSNSLGRF